jgi:replicative DNA helicase
MSGDSFITDNRGRVVQRRPAPPADPAASRLPPFDADAEVALLTAVIGDERALMAAIEIVDFNSFYIERNRKVFRAIVTLAETGSALDAVTVCAELARRGELESVGGKDYVYVDLVGAGAFAPNVTDYAKIVREKADRRQLIETLATATRELYGTELAVKDIATDLQATLLPVAAEMRGEGFVHVKHDLWPLIESIEALARSGSKVPACAVPTGYPEIDQQIAGGFERGEFVVIAGVPGGCKTALATNIALNVTCPIVTGTPAIGALIVSAEMTRRKLHMRNLAAVGRIDFRSLREGNLRDDDYTRLARASSALSNCPLWVDQTPTPSITDIVAKCRKQKAEHPEIGLIVVDFIQLVQRALAAKRTRDENRSAELTDIAYTLKGLGKELDVAVVATCQVDAADIEKRTDKRPRLGDARWSQGMREAADLFATCYRPKTYSADAMMTDTLEVAFGKARDSETFTAILQWTGQHMLLTSQKQRAAA